jgi:threonine dehydratase/cystathionine beta-lyase/cystathionine gamma-synthase
MEMAKTIARDEAATLGIDPFAAREELSGHVVRTVVRRLRWLERWLGVPVWAKLEFQQHTGSFKYRGAHLATARGTGRAVIAASAGNHGLAVAEAARRLGRPASICLPLVASRLKRERILGTDAVLIEHGSSLEEATAHARRLAAAEDLQYISPYNDRSVIAGAATMALEFFEDAPEITPAVVPLGGGGLASGFAVAAAATGRDLDLIGCEPQRYASVAASLKAGEIVRVVHQPTFADGLAVNLEPDSITFDLLRRHLRQTVALSEEDLAAATLALLVHESLLVEPAGAASLIACLRLAQQGRLRGPVGIPLCGGNIQQTTLVKVQRFPYADEDLLRLLDLRGRSVAHTPVARTHSAGASRPREPHHGGLVPERLVQLDSCLAQLDAAAHEVDEYARYCAEHGLVVDPSLTGSLSETVRSARAKVAADREGLRGGLAKAPDAAGLLLRSEAALRFATATAAHVRSALEWCSPSYAQSGAVQFFNTGAQDSPMVNYDRYGSADTKRTETQLLNTFGLPGDEFAVTATSSGMAAYTLVESFLLRERLSPGDTVLTAPYIYFEAAEQLDSLPGVVCVRADGYETADLLAAVEEHRPRCLFVDPVANTARQRMVDVPELLAELRLTATRPLTVVIDGTMASGALDADTLRGGGLVEVIYYESCSKYLQLGHDAAMAGMVIHPAEETARFERLRRNTGTILYARTARLFPSFDRELFLARMRRICENARAVAEKMAADPRVGAMGEVFCPGAAGHVDAAKADRIAYTGGCVTFLYHQVGDNHRDQLEAMLERALAAARERGLYVTKGVSFGFSAPRISAAASMAESEPPFLRVYVGDLGPEQTALLAEVMADAIAES